MPTASSVVAGVIDLATGRGQQTFRALGLWDSDPPGPAFEPSAHAKSRFYLRFTISDRPGTLARIASILESTASASPASFSTRHLKTNRDCPSRSLS